ncbi:hypothetical protein P3X46_010469 [Hevea brasiliensis]|uniref:Uncharacterized protein n=1 Tax=Hevea brasiliensis TaxID=3981 RepID=A0ABQ9MEG7_HEVBR|nr:hypothetical protein P3X46_010469 [Hevea brasiliensis]
MVGISREQESWETDEIWQKVNQTAIKNDDNSSGRSNFSSKSKSNSTKKKNQVLLEGYVEVANNEDDLKRTKSLTDDDLDELKGSFLMNSISLPRSSPTAAETASSPIANWKISSPGDHPEDVKARLKFWAQAVACTVRLCS